jgi:uncharacterized membrane protein YoaK (UPF0700 family)
MIRADPHWLRWVQVQSEGSNLTMLPFHAQPLAVPRLLPACLGFVAGFIDACTFFALFHFFVAQVTGSFVIAGEQFVGLDKTMLAPIFAIPVFFLMGMSTTLLLAWSGRTGWIALAAGLAVELALVIAFFIAGMIGAPFVDPNAPLAVASGLLGISAMGVQSALVRLLMRGVGSTNVMTSNTTQLAIDAAEWLIAAYRKRVMLDDPGVEADYATLRVRFAWLFSIMAGFLVGTICGALGYRWFGLWCLLGAIAVLVGVVVYCAWRAIRS